VVERQPTHGASQVENLFVADVTNENEVTRVLTDVVNALGRLDVLINLVGAFTPGEVIKTDLGVWQKMLTLNVTAAFLLSRAVIPKLSAQHRDASFSQLAPIITPRGSLYRIGGWCR
jgi:NAD(P)-dependent dehydrogenase (short-subunit alcohol dehydrogenase family)